VSPRFSIASLYGILLGLSSLGCEEQTIEVELHSLQASGEVAFVCRTKDGTGIDRSQCPDFEEEGHKMFALVTQTSTEEVAVIDTFEAAVVDLDPSTPGYAFLRVPSKPENIVSTPGGQATFVTITGRGKDGITAIPTTCISPPKKDQTALDVTSFPSCHLPATPGDIAVLIAPPEADGTVRGSCDPASGPEEPPIAASRSECASDLTREHLDEKENVVGPIGRRKLAVALPDRGEIAIIDAQWLLDQVPGSFSDCRIEATHRLEVDLGPAGITQRLDAAQELVPPPGCVITYPLTPERPASFAPRPAGFGSAGDVLYVADQGAPVVHVLDMSNPCAPQELPSLLPMSFDWPSRVVTTSKVAASPLTPSGKRYVYAIDEWDASLMAFDVSPDSTDRTPLVRPGSLRVPEPPDRLKLGTAITDVAFALRDIETTDPETGVAESGVRCDPNWMTAPPDSPAAQHRPTSDRSRGAQPRLLRGLFGLAMLNTGHVAIIDVDDFDGPCRRPYTTNPSPNEDFRGCKDDVGLPQFLTLDGTTNAALTVTNEVSCSVVETHRFRSALMGRTNTTDGTGTATLSAAPEFNTDAETGDRTPQELPKLLAVPFEPTEEGGPAPDPEVYIGTTLYKKGNPSADLVTDPNTALVASLTLPFAEPRSLPAAEISTLTYEGALHVENPSGRFAFDPESPIAAIQFRDATAQFCDLGVYDREMLDDLAVNELGVEEDDAAARDAFVREHSDVVELTAEFLPSIDAYWLSPRLIDPESEGGCGLDYGTCVDTFGEYDPPEVNPNRQLSVVEAYQDFLVVEPLNADDDEERTRLAKRLSCCFPTGLSYRVHVRKQWMLASSGILRSDVTSHPELLGNPDDPDAQEEHFRCTRNCDPQKRYWNSRVFEITSTENCSTVLSGAVCAVGFHEAGDPCAYDPCEGVPGGCTRLDGSLDLAKDTGATSCIHSGVTSRFAVYRGLLPSVRGMQFSWQTTGGFRPLVASLAAVSIAVLPQQVQYVPELQRIALVDGAQLGLTLISLDSLRVEDPWPVY
jgi:hypothetical protein